MSVMAIPQSEKSPNITVGGSGEQGPTPLTPPVITVHAAKGGVGKTTIAYELAAALGAVLVDLDWDGGGATRMWSNEPRSARLLDALEAGRAPRPRSAPNRPDIVPSHRDMATARVLDREELADAFAGWATAWARPVVLDTHPGMNAFGEAALQAASIVVVPVVLARQGLSALAEMLDERRDFPLLLVPNLVPRRPNARMVEALGRLVGDVPVAPVIHEHRLLPRRLRRAALVLSPALGRAAREAAEEFRAVADVVAAYAREAADARA